MKKFVLILAAVCCTMMAQAAKVDKNVNITINGETRNYQLYVPNNATDNCPLVVSLHGANGASTNKAPFRTDVADQAGCIVVYPQGKQTAFPVGFGGSTTGWTSTGEYNFDAEFLMAVIEDVAKTYPIDRKRIYCCGFSNGGMMTYAMSNACSNVFAAFASISGFQLNEFHFRHTGWRPVPFLHIHGKADDFVKYSLIPSIVDDMVAHNGANPVPTKTAVSGQYTKSVYEAGEGGFPYVYYEIDGMGHSDFTTNTEDGSSAKTMWNFFKQYTLDSPCDTTLKWAPRIETEGFVPKSHGWNVNVKVSGTAYLLRFGATKNTQVQGGAAGNQNVYRSLQFDNGCYKLHFKAEGDADKQVVVQLQKNTDGQNYLLKDTLSANGEHDLLFKVEDGWGEYKLSFIGKTVTDGTTISNITIHTASQEEQASVQAPVSRKANSADAYTLAGIKATTSPRSGSIYIRNNKKFFSK